MQPAETWDSSDITDWDDATAGSYSFNREAREKKKFKHITHSTGGEEIQQKGHPKFGELSLRPCFPLKGPGWTDLSNRVNHKSHRQARPGFLYVSISPSLKQSLSMKGLLLPLGFLRKAARRVISFRDPFSHQQHFFLSHPPTKDPAAWSWLPSLPPLMPFSLYSYHKRAVSWEDLRLTFADRLQAPSVNWSNVRLGN